ncbi:hypothetical protein AB4Y32_06940 [Paraburkholderia phymatum]|uniref:Uncharacterized protein n=1 Tax=Paraburkholderia phymatum TaxID=148447 RepID=A0ACC6TW49_9BURK
MNREENSADTSTSRPDDAPQGQPQPPDTTKELPELPDPVEVGEDG